MCAVNSAHISSIQRAVAPRLQDKAQHRQRSVSQPCMRPSLAATLANSLACMLGLLHSTLPTSGSELVAQPMNVLTCGMTGTPSGWPRALLKSPPLPTSVATILGALSVQVILSSFSPVRVAMLIMVSVTWGAHRRNTHQHKKGVSADSMPGWVVAKQAGQKPHKYPLIVSRAQRGV